MSRVKARGVSFWRFSCLRRMGLDGSGDLETGKGRARKVGGRSWVGTEEVFRRLCLWGIFGRYMVDKD